MEGVECSLFSHMKWGTAQMIAIEIVVIEDGLGQEESICAPYGFDA